MSDDVRGLETYDGFLKAAIRSYWEEGHDRANFISLLLASREAWQVAWEGVQKPGTGKKVLTGAAGAAAVMVLIRVLLGGPIGLALSALSLASLGALYVKNHHRIWAQQERYRDLIARYRARHQQLRGKYVDGVIDEEERDLMLDGLLRRFLTDLDEAPDLGEPAPPPVDEDEPGEDDDERN